MPEPTQQEIEAAVRKAATARKAYRDALKRSVDACDELRALAKDLPAPAIYVVGDEKFTLTPATVGLDSLTVSVAPACRYVYLDGE